MNNETMDKVIDLLTLAADMESFSSVGDELSKWVEQCGESELSEDDLSFVAAANSGQSYLSFLKKFRLEGKE